MDEDIELDLAFILSVCSLLILSIVFRKVMKSLPGFAVGVAGAGVTVVVIWNWSSFRLFLSVPCLF